MRPPLVDKAKEFSKLRAEKQNVENEISELRKDGLGVESEETEEKARQLFAEVGDPEDGNGVSDQIDELREKRDELKKQLDSVKEDLWKQVADIRFPLEGTIETQDDRVVFPYDEQIEPEVLEAIETVLEEDFSNNGVTIGTESIIVETDSTDEAIESVDRRVSQLRSRAETHYDAADHVEKLRSRDSKVAGMMYTLREVGEPLTKSEMEEEMNLSSGDLRGQLYHVLKRDPYLRKSDKKVELTPTGEKVIDEYIKQEEEPTWEKLDEDSEEVEA